MLSPAMLHQVRRLHLRAKKAVEDLLGGAYRSVFKGVGISFEEVREYQPGDEIRSIDWNVTARMGHPFVKRYVEERELTVLLLLDVSASQAFGTQVRQKRDAAAELAALLSLAALANHDKVGLITFTDRIESFLPPRKGSRHALRVIRTILHGEPVGRGTRYSVPLERLLRTQHRRAIVFLLSDFLHWGDERLVRQAAVKHDLIAVRHSDPLEAELPDAGLVDVEDPETGETRLLDFGDPQFRQSYQSAMAEQRESVRRSLRSSRIDLIDVSTADDHVESLVRFFRLRERRRGRRS
ncbi:MAG: DUF58 domain-containing protein [Gemmataceae bacterium]